MALRVLRENIYSPDEPSQHTKSPTESSIKILYYALLILLKNFHKPVSKLYIYIYKRKKQHVFIGFDIIFTGSSIILMLTYE